MQNFFVNQHSFSQVLTAGAAKAWVCAANGIRISERLNDANHRWEYIASRPAEGGSGTQFLQRRQHMRTFVSPANAASAALAAWE